MASLTLRSVKGSPLTNNEIDTNFTNLDDDIQTRLLAADYTASDVLAKLISVQGNGAGVDSDFLNGRESATLNTANTVVYRDASGNFAAGTITANLIGNVTGNADTATNGVVTTGSYANPTWITSLAGSKVTSIPNTSLTNSTITINGTAVALGGSISISGSANTWTSQQTFRDTLFAITDDVDNSKVLNFQLSAITAGVTRTLIAPDETGIIATRAYADGAGSLYTNSYVPTYVQTAGRNSQGTKTISTAAPSGGSNGDIWYRV
jgi:hypothetical protein